MKSEKIYYSIKEVSQLTGLPFSTLHYWESIFKQLSPKKNEGGTRFYRQEDIDIINRIKYLRQTEHMTIEAVKKRLAIDGQKRSPTQTAIDLLQQIRKELQEIKNLL
ncbi:MAG: MerR family transcriptional regulator [Paludibacteraceae bacterium]|nr:MerR family transcriptional regulator [Paludibacteraceae bacterium]